MLIPNDWRFVAEGNAHIVYRYIGPANDYFSGMVLKLPKNPSINEDRRLFHQYRFIQGIVVGDPFNSELGRDLRSNGSYDQHFSLDDNSEEEEDDDESESDEENELNRPPLCQKQCNSLIGGSQSDAEESTIVSTDTTNTTNRTTNKGCKDQTDHTHGTDRLDVPLSTVSSRQKFRPPPDHGLVSPVHIPAQKLHLFENRHTNRLRQQIRPFNNLPASAAAQPTSDAILLSPASSPSMTGRNSPVTSSIRRFSACVHKSPLPWQSQAKKPINPRSSRRSSPFHSSYSTSRPLSPTLHSLSDCKFGTPPDSFHDPSSVNSRLSRSSFALLERDLVTPPIAPHRLLSLGAYCNLSGDFPPCNSNNAGWIYFTCELKPKTGLPAVVRDDLSVSQFSTSLNAFGQLPTSQSPFTNKKIEFQEMMSFGKLKKKDNDQNVSSLAVDQFPSCDNPPMPIPLRKSGHEVSRFTMQQYFKVSKGVLKHRSSYLPEVFFARLSDRNEIKHQLRSLLQCPQNNWRLFIDGVRILWTEDQKQSHYPVYLNVNPITRNNDLNSNISDVIQNLSSNFVPQPSPFSLVPRRSSSQAFRISHDLSSTIEWPPSVVLTVQQPQAAENLLLYPSDIRSHDVEPYGCRTSDIFPRWMSWSSPTAQQERSDTRGHSTQEGNIVEGMKTIKREESKNKDIIETTMVCDDQNSSSTPSTGAPVEVVNPGAFRNDLNCSSSRKRLLNRTGIETDNRSDNTKISSSPKSSVFSVNSLDLTRYHNPVFRLFTYFPSVQLMMTRFGILPQSSEVNAAIAPNECVQNEISTHHTSAYPSAKNSSTLPEPQSPLHGNKVTPSSPVVPVRSSFENDPVTLNDRARLFHSVFPTDITTGLNEYSTQQGLEGWSNLVGDVLSIEKNLFHRLLYVHALCEGQQHIAAELLDQLKQIGWVKKQKAITVTSPETTEMMTLSQLIDQKLMSVAHGTQSLKEFLIGMEADIAKDTQNWLFPVATENNKDVKSDPEALFALRVQTWHWTKGRELLNDGNLLLQKEEFFPDEHIQKMVHWIYRFLIGRTFLDCSVMTNIAIKIDENSTDEDDVQLLVKNRFLKLATIPVRRVTEKTQPETELGEDELSIHQSLRALRIPVFFGDHTNADGNKTSGDSCSVNENNIFSSTSSGSTNHESSDAQQQLSSSRRHKWHSIDEILKLNYYSDDSCRDKTLSIWYRLSVVDLDLKQASKIPQWATQLDNILQAFRSASEQQ